MKDMNKYNNYRLVSSNNFYYCRFKDALPHLFWLVSSNNFYYCRFSVFILKWIKG